MVMDLQTLLKKRCRYIKATILVRNHKPGAVREKKPDI